MFIRGFLIFALFIVSNLANAELYDCGDGWVVKNPKDCRSEIKYINKNGSV